MIAFLEYDGEIVPYFSEHPLLHYEYDGFLQDDTFLSPDKVVEMVGVLDNLKSEEDSNYRSRFQQGTLCYAAAVMSDFMECIGNPAEPGDKSKSCVHIVVPC